MSKCKCDLRTKLVGDGCEVCNPSKALEYAKMTIADLEEDICQITRQRDELLAACETYMKYGLDEGYYAIRGAIASVKEKTVHDQSTALSAMIAKAGEVMRERCMRAYWISPAELCHQMINALPSVTLDDIK